MTSIERLHIALREPAQRGRRHADAGGGGEQVHVVVHQYIGVHGDGILRHGTFQKLQVMSPIVIVDEYAAAIHAAMRDVQR
jgi:hypothetical protein